MGRALIEIYPVFKESLQFAHDHFATLGAKWNLIGEALFPICTMDY
jgi:hypothetical protein